MSLRETYFNFIEQGFQRDRTRLDSEVARWKAEVQDNALLGYMPPRTPLHLAAVASFLFEQSGDERLAKFALENLLCYRTFPDYYPKDAIQRRPEYAYGVPPLDAVFDPAYFAPACARLRPIISGNDYEQLASIAADSLRLIWLFPEWGGHNRAMLRAASLAACARTFSDHPDVDKWISMADELAEESWGRWSIEDTQMYQAHWLRAMILYAESREKTEFFDFIQPRLYTRAIVQLLSPLGILPDFGDSHWMTHNQWEWLALMEWGARIYRDPAMKWSANKLWRRQQLETPNLYASLVLILAWNWCDENILPQPPQSTPDALDDLVIKKLVLRSGWDENAAYACINYRDEGDYGRVARDYLRTNLAVSAEKMHHGHADEGSFSMLVHAGCLLLHESGYREQPPDGKYRADIYHNRLVWRPRVKLPGESIWEFLEDDGYYRPVRTERLYESRLCGVDICRIRVIDEKQALSWDRSIFFIAEIPLWLVIDCVMALDTAPRTYSALWWTVDILEQEQNWFKTQIPQVQSWKNKTNAALWIGFPPIPSQPNRVELCDARRCFQTEKLIANNWSGEHRLNRVVNFVTLLQPADKARTFADIDLHAVVRDSYPMKRSLGVTLSWSGETIELIGLNDLTAGYLQEDVRPRYNAEQGWWKVGEVGSDAVFVVLRRNQAGTRAGFINGTRLVYSDQVLYQGLPHAMFQEDRTHMPGIPARFRWECNR